tara:strand:+ start:454 stop:666 length:213 start_codon:yes stop_codon:yes gene_type:complete
VKKKKEANLISWKIVIDETNNLITEIKQFPEDKVEEIFKEDSSIIRAILRNAKAVLEPLHNELQKYLRRL